jgi:serine phosphatase RsbU (regulator of sigma subunit)
VLVAGDVCGKGVAAALFMAVLRSLVRVLADQWGLDPGGEAGALLARVAGLINRQIAEVHGGANMFATTFLAALDPPSGRLVYVNAGHDPPVLVRSGGVERLEPTGPAVGLLPGLEFRVAEARLEAGDLLCVHTDGVPEARNAARAFYGEDRLLACLTGARGRAADAALAALLADVDGFAGGAEQADDITLLAVRRA